MLKNANGICICYTGYVLRDDGKSCRFNCAEGFIYDAQSDTCVLKPVVCQPGQSLNPRTQQCQRKVIRCPEGSQLNELTQQCESCPPNFTYNATISRCQAAVSITCPSAYNYNPSTKLCDLKPITLPTPITPITPPTLAVICTNGFSYNQASQRCEQVSITNPNTENLITNNMSLYQNNYNQKRLENPNIKDCASSSPFYDSTLGSCVSCPEQYPFFNLVTNKCQDCGDGKYDSTTYKCQPKGLNYDPTLSRFVMNVL